MGLLSEAEAEAGHGVEGQAEPVILALETVRWAKVYGWRVGLFVA